MFKAKIVYRIIGLFLILLGLVLYSFTDLPYEWKCFLLSFFEITGIFIFFNIKTKHKIPGDWVDTIIRWSIAVLAILTSLFIYFSEAEKQSKIMIGIIVLSIISALMLLLYKRHFQPHKK